MPEEMILLRNALTSRGVEWQNESDNLDRSFPFLNLIMYRTSFKWKNKRYSVICGYGTLGGTKGLLELHKGNDDPVGSLTAVEVLERMDND